MGPEPPAEYLGQRASSKTQLWLAAPSPALLLVRVALGLLLGLPRVQALWVGSYSRARAPGWGWRDPGHKQNSSVKAYGAPTMS